MGAQYVAIGDHDLPLDEVVRLPIRFATMAFTEREQAALVNVSISPVAEPPPPLRAAKLWIIDLPETVSVAVGVRSFAVHFPSKLIAFLTTAAPRQQHRQTTREIASVFGSYSTLFCTDHNSTWDWDLVERGDRVAEAISLLEDEHHQSRAEWDAAFTEDEVSRHDFRIPFFIDTY